MGLFTLIAALIGATRETIKEKIENERALEEKRQYENIDWDNIDFVFFNGTETAYRIEEEEEFDPVASYFLTQQDGWQHYETKTVEYEVEDGLNYCFSIKYKDGTEIYRVFHESSPLTDRLLEHYNKNMSDIVEGVQDVADALGNLFTSKPKADTEKAPEEKPKRPKERFAVIDFETTGVNYNFRRPPMDEIISVAIIDQDENVLLNTYCDTVNIKSWYEAERVNGISPRDVKGYPTFVEIMPKVIEILSSYDYVISYNVPFEKSFLENYAYLYTPTDFSVSKIKWGEDPMQMFMEHMNSRRFLKLTTAAEHFGYKYNAHDALEDTKAALYVYKALKSK